MKDEAKEMLKKIKDMRFDNPLVAKAIAIQGGQGLTDFETITLLAYYTLKQLEAVQKQLLDVYNNSGNPIDILK